MNRLIIPQNVCIGHTAFFTGKNPGADTDAIAKLLDIQKKNIYFPVQRHTDKIHIIESLREPVIADAVITKEKGLLIGVQVADCVPVLVHDPVRSVVAVVHAGWRGTAQEILKKTLLTLCKRFFCDPLHLQVAIGPAIRQCCYEVDGDVFRSVSSATGTGEYHRKKGDKFLIDLPAANKMQAMHTGIAEANIWMSGDCTFCNPERFYSYRYSGGICGRQAGFAGIL